MSTAGVVTGVPVTGSSSICDEPIDPCVYFDAESTEPCSAVFTVEEPWQVVVYNLPPGDEVILQQVSGGNEGEFFADVAVNGQGYKLDANNNRMMVPFAGRFRLRYVGTLGTATVLCEPSNCCIGPMFPAQDQTGAIQVNDAFGTNLFLGDPVNV